MRWVSFRKYSPTSAPVLTRLQGKMSVIGGTRIATFKNKHRLVFARNGILGMFIHEMTYEECLHALRKARVGRLGCARDNQPYVVPIYFAFDGTYVYGFTTVGQKIEWMRSNPQVCLEVDEEISDQQWTSIIIFGRYEELPDNPEHKAARTRAYASLQKRIMWWEPAYISQAHRDQPHSLTPIFYRIRIERITGHHATADVSEPVATVQSHTIRHGWLDKLLHP
jgi:uncharacterized protein